MMFQTVRPVIAALALGLALAGCTANKELPPCPPVYVLGDAKSVTQFRPGTGRDLTDVVSSGEIVGWHGQCHYVAQADKKDTWNVEVELQLTIEAKRGPANEGRKADFVYFVSIPVFYPAPEAKTIFPVSIPFPTGTDVVRHVDEPVNLTIPVPAKDDIGKYAIYLGFQTTPDELQFNRKSQ